jgi:hypothetical protein
VFSIFCITYVGFEAFTAIKIRRFSFPPYHNITRRHIPESSLPQQPLNSRYNAEYT